MNLGSMREMVSTRAQSDPDGPSNLVCRPGCTNVVVRNVLEAASNVVTETSRATATNAHAIQMTNRQITISIDRTHMIQVCKYLLKIYFV